MRSIQEEIDNNPTPDIFFIKIQSDGILYYGHRDVDIFVEGADDIFFSRCNIQGSCYEGNIIRFFLEYCTPIFETSIDENTHQNDIEIIYKYIRKSNENVDILQFEEIDNTDLLTEDERNELYTALIRYDRVQEKRNAIRAWLQELDEKRQQLKSKNFIDEL